MSATQVGDFAKCCKEASEIIFRRKSYMTGPDETGWTMNFGVDGDPCYETINFCPWCGRKLEQKKS